MKYEPKPGLEPPFPLPFSTCSDADSTQRFHAWMPYRAFRGSDRPPHGLFSGVVEAEEEEEEVEVGPELSSTACRLFPFTCTAVTGRSSWRPGAVELLSFCLCTCLRG